MIDYPNELDNILDKLQKHYIYPVIVGGYIRDYFLKLEHTTIKDIDIELYNAESFEQIEDILSEFGNPNIIGKSFGVIKLKVNQIEIDFSMPRTDNKIGLGHKGFLVSTNKNLDFQTASIRRDFTINAIGYDFFSKKLLDPFNGLTDLKNKKLKMVNKNSFVEDPLRVLRAMQFCARFNFTADKELIDVAKSMCHQNLLDELPKERIYEEFKKLFLKSNTPSIGFKFLKDIDALVFFNELVMSENDWNKILKYIDNIDKTNLKNNTTVTVMFAIICYKMDKSFMFSFINKLTNKKNILKNLNTLYHVDSFLKNKNNLLKYNIMKDLDIEMLITYLNAKYTPTSTTEKIYNIKPLIHGNQLLKIGMNPSKEFSSLLQLIYEVQIKKLFT